MRNLETANRIQDKRSDCDKGSEEHDSSGTLFLKMHSSCWVWQFIVEILVDETCSVSEVMFKIIYVHHVIVDKGTSVLVLRFEIETNVVPMGRPNFVVRMQSMAEVFWHW